MVVFLYKDSYKIRSMMSIKEAEISSTQLSLLETFPSAAAILNNSGDIIIANTEWEQKSTTGFFIDTPIGRNFFEHCSQAVEAGSDDALMLVIGLRRVLDRETTSFQSTCSARNQHKGEWYRVNIKPYEESGAILFIEDITESISAVHDLRDSQEKYRQQFDYSINGIIIGTPEGKVLDANPAACKILGYTLQELKEGGRRLIMNEDDPINKKASKEREKKSVFVGEKKYLHKSGKEISAMVSSVIYRDKDRGLTTINSFWDVTREKKIQKKLENEQKFTRTAIASIPGTFYVLDAEGAFLDWNEAFQEELGYDREDMLQMKPTDFFVEDDRELIRQKLEEVVEKGRAETVGRVVTKLGAVRHHKLNVRSFTNDNATYIVGTGMDITELVETKTANNRHYELMSQLFENAPLGIVMIDHNNQISRVNNGFKELFGYTSEDVIGLNVNDLVTTDEIREEADNISKEAFSGTISQMESYRYTKSGKKVPVLISSVPVSTGGEVTAVYGIYADLTPQKELEKQITNLLSSEREARQKAQKSLKEKEILLQEVHHRVKNNLAVMAGLLDLQLLEEDDQVVFKKLSEVQSRIFSIAKIHETLYQEKNMVHIRFNRYLKSFIKFLPQQGFNNEIISKLNVNCEETTLNLNQAVPAGLIINELINVLLPDSGNGALVLDLSSDNDTVLIQLSGEDLKTQKFSDNIDSEQFQYKLVSILASQLHGKIEVDTEKKCVSVQFSRNEMKGSSNAFLH